jgi:hypothetical protein
MRVVRLYFTCQACKLEDICLGFHVRDESTETVEQWQADATDALKRLHHQLRPTCKNQDRLLIKWPPEGTTDVVRP